MALYQGPIACVGQKRRAADEQRYEHERVITSLARVVMNQWVYHVGSLKSLDLGLCCM